MARARKDRGPAEGPNVPVKDPFAECFDWRPKPDNGPALLRWIRHYREAGECRAAGRPFMGGLPCGLIANGLHDALACLTLSRINQLIAEDADGLVAELEAAALDGRAGGNPVASRLLAMLAEAERRESKGKPAA